MPYVFADYIQRFTLMSDELPPYIFLGIVTENICVLTKPSL